MAKKTKEQSILHKRSINGNIVTEVTKRKLGKYEFYCNNCNTIHQMSYYAIAQRAMRNHIVFECSCGNKVYL